MPLDRHLWKILNPIGVENWQESRDIGKNKSYLKDKYSLDKKQNIDIFCCL